MCWLDLLSQFDMTINHIPRKFNVVVDALLYCPDLSAVVGSIESSLLTQIRGAYAAASGDSCKQLKIA